MSTPTAIQQPAPPSTLKRLVTRHPVAAFLMMAFTVSITIAFASTMTFVSAPANPFITTHAGQLQETGKGEEPISRKF